MRMSQCPQGEAALTDRLPRTSEVVDVAPQGIAIESPAPLKRKPKRTQPTERSMKYLRDNGYPLVAVVEKWIPHIKQRKDLFGIIDILAVNDAGVLAVQATGGDGGNVAARVAKIAESDALPLLLRIGWRIVVHGWRKNANGRWTLREVEL
jgi:hypothetical protein